MNKTQKLLVALVAASALSTTSFASENTGQIGIYGGLSLAPALNEFKAPLDKADLTQLTSFKSKDYSMNLGGGVYAQYNFITNGFVGIDLGGTLTAHTLSPEKPEDTLVGKAAIAAATAALASGASITQDQINKAVADAKESLTIAAKSFLPAIALGGTMEITEDIKVHAALLGGYGFIFAETPVHSHVAASAAKDSKATEEKLEHIKFDTHGTFFGGLRAGLLFNVNEIVNVGLVLKGTYLFNSDLVAKNEKPAATPSTTKDESIKLPFGNLAYVIGVSVGVNF